jgi:VCBS repeat-containing protein
VVSSADGSAQGTITVNITGTNDAPVLSVSTQANAVDQGQSNTVDLFVASSTDSDAIHKVTYSLGADAIAAVGDTVYFVIDPTSGKLTLTHDGAAAIAADPVGDWKVTVIATDDKGAKDEELVTIHVNMAVSADGTSANLPGSVSQWNFKPADIVTTDLTTGEVVLDDNGDIVTTTGFLLTRNDDPAIQVKIPGTVAELSFDNATVGLDNTGLVGVIEVGTVSGKVNEATHTVTIAPDAIGNTSVVLTGGSSLTVQGASDDAFNPFSGEFEENFRSDTITVSVDYSEATFVTRGDDSYVEMSFKNEGGTTTTILLNEVEAVKFADGQTVRIVGAGGYDTVAEANLNAGEHVLIYVAPLAVTTTAGQELGTVVEEGTFNRFGQLNVSLPTSASGTPVWAFESVNGDPIDVTTVGGVSMVTTEHGTVTIDTVSGYWTYALANSSDAVQSMADGESFSEDILIRTTDAQGSTITQTVTVTVQGTNDGPVVVSSGSDFAGAAMENATVVLSDSGVINFGDVDLSDTHTAEVTSHTGTLGGTLELNTSEGDNANTGSVGWTYTVDSSATEYLGQGEKAVETFTVTIDDGKGSTVDQLVTVTITGTNDRPTIVALTTDDQGAVVEEASQQWLSNSGVIAFTDVDLVDGHTVDRLLTLRVDPKSRANGECQIRGIYVTRRSRSNERRKQSHTRLAVCGGLANRRS